MSAEGDLESAASRKLLTDIKRELIDRGHALDKGNFDWNIGMDRQGSGSVRSGQKRCSGVGQGGRTTHSSAVGGLYPTPKELAKTYEQSSTPTLPIGMLRLWRRSPYAPLSPEMLPCMRESWTLS